MNRPRKHCVYPDAAPDAHDLGCDCPSWRCLHAICAQCEPACEDCEREANEAAAETDAIVERMRRERDGHAA